MRSSSGGDAAVTQLTVEGRLRIAAISVAWLSPNAFRPVIIS
jgi:hypothetical protein